jgi:hypothetical protein
LLSGVSLAGDDELLAGPKESQRPTRDEWMTTLPPERKVNDRNIYLCNCFIYNPPKYAYFIVISYMYVIFFYLSQAGVPMHSTTSFSMNGKEGRGDTSVWTDTPLDRAQKAQQRYAY